MVGTGRDLTFDARAGARGLARRTMVLATVVAGIAAASAPFGSASAQTALQGIIQQNQQRVEWRDQFDTTTMRSLQSVESSFPTLSPDTASYVEMAIQRYSAIVQQGGWNRVTSGRKAMRLGAREDNVVSLRRRLMVSGDLEQTAGLSSTFDSYVDAAVRRFQIRHG